MSVRNRIQSPVRVGEEKMDDFRAFVISVSEELSSEDVDKIAYIFKLPSDSREPRRGALDVLQTLEKKNLFSASSLHGLSELMHLIGREDVAQLVKTYQPSPSRFLPASPLVSLRNSCLRIIGRSTSDLGPARGELTESLGGATGNFRERGFSLPTPSLCGASPITAIGSCKKWILARKNLNEDIYEHRCCPFQLHKSIQVDVAQAGPGCLPAPRLHLTLYPSGLETDKGSYATLEARVVLPTGGYGGQDMSSVRLLLKASAHDFPDGKVIGEGMKRSNLNAQKVRVFRFISHEALKTSHSKHIEVRMWAWASLLGDDEYTVEPVEEGF